MWKDGIKVGRDTKLKSDTSIKNGFDDEIHTYINIFIYKVSNFGIHIFILDKKYIFWKGQSRGNCGMANVYNGIYAKPCMMIF